MPPPKGKEWSHFVTVEVADGNGKKTTHANCKYCGKQYTFPNATRMRSHLSRCKTCPQSIRKLFLQEGCDDLDGNMPVDDPAPLQDLQREEENNPSHSTSSNASMSNAAKDYSPHNPKKRKTGMGYFVDTVSKAEKDKLDEAFARAAFAKGYPLTVFEGPHMAEAFRQLRPSYQPPNRDQLGGKLLDAEYDRVMNDVKSKVENATSLTLATDGWTNRRYEGIVNFVLCTPEPVFVKSVELGDKKEDANFVSGEVIKVIIDVGADSVFLLVTDNASNMRLMWTKVKASFPKIFAIGCGSHCLNLLFKDIMTIPFLKELLVQSKAVIKVKRKRAVNATLQQKQKENYGQAVSLTLPGKTRFYGAYSSFLSLQKNKKALQETVIVENLDVPSAARKYVLDNDFFWPRINFACNLLKPIADGIQLLEADDAKLSHTVAILMNIKESLRNLIVVDPNGLSPLSVRECEKALMCLERRIEFTVKDVHLAAYLLDPVFHGKGLSDSEIVTAMETITKIAQDLNLNDQKVAQNLLDFRTKKGIYGREVLWKEIIVDPLQWWEGYCSQQPLAPIALRLLSASPTSIACERVWSAYEHIQSKKRNRLLNTRTEKLVAIKSNLNVFGKPDEQKKVKLENRMKILRAYPSVSLFSNHLTIGEDEVDLPEDVDLEHAITDDDDDSGVSDADADSDQ